MPDEDREYVEKVIEHDTADARRHVGMRAKGFAPDEAGVKPDEVLMAYDRLWGQVRDARDREDDVALFYALKGLLVRYGNDADLLRGRLQSEFGSGAPIPEVVGRALSDAWEPVSPASRRRRGIVSRLRIR